ncbi:MAG: type III-B CRISPR module RAMP protein Cmr1 [Candidatus Omnitrophica bacterium]|nr:type III-B CRISPR module RAMP protein Cmr1 [Candidatus Omnitrophota bacterium]
MIPTKGERTYRLRALTDLWTGDFAGKSDRLITTGLLGSIRWWFEVLVRGLGGSACDPTDRRCGDRDHCVVCELFGCTGWARKFRFEVLDENGNIREARNNAETKISPQIEKDENDKFSLRFTPLRPIRDEEWALLDATLRLIADYGALGGKTVLKPTDEADRTKEKHHQDYGLVEFIEPLEANIPITVVKEYVTQEKWQKLDHREFAWASLQNFWCVNGRYLARQNSNQSTFNRVIERQEAKKQGQQLAHNNKASGWLAGSPQQRKERKERKDSKKVFSFKDPARTFGFVKPGLIDFNTMKERLTNAWGKNGWDFLTGDKIKDQLFAGKEDRS